jgi:hypothetical protein
VAALAEGGFVVAWNGQGTGDNAGVSTTRESTCPGAQA